VQGGKGSDLFSVDHLNALRLAELEKIAPHLSPASRILEIGAGTGEQAADLSRRGFDVTAIELADSAYAAQRVYPIADYNGTQIPFPDASFDIVFSSNVLEHVGDLTTMHAEIKRVLKPGGVCIHVLPTPAWRFWTIVASYPMLLVYFWYAMCSILPGSRHRNPRQAWYEVVRQIAVVFIQPRHGERGNGISELWLFHPRWWRKNFRDNGFELIGDEPLNLFYTGYLLFGRRLGFGARKALAGYLGSACHLYRLKPNTSS
jgi:SAM-dependent methyltransferase